MINFFISEAPLTFAPHFLMHSRLDCAGQNSGRSPTVQRKINGARKVQYLASHLLLTNLIKRGVLRKEGVELDPILGCLKKCGVNFRGASKIKKLTIELTI